MALERQVNIWRGNSTPPTIHHIWIYQDSKLLLYNGTEWIVFIDDVAIIDKLNGIEQRLTDLELAVDTLNNTTVNNKLIKDNPILDAGDLRTKSSGNFITGTSAISDTLVKIDTLLNTQIIE